MEIGCLFPYLPTTIYFVLRRFEYKEFMLGLEHRGSSGNQSRAEQL